MSVLLFLLLFVPLSLVVAWWVAERNDRVLLLRRTAVAWLVLGPLTASVNVWMPYSGAGDDESYYELADPAPTSVGDALDFARFTGSMQQPGYPWLLSLLNAAVGHDLLAYKLLNLFFFITLSLVWYRIGLDLEGPHFALAVSLWILALTPLWFYVFVLRKDMLIVLLQSLFLLGVVHVWQRFRFAPLLLIASVSLGVASLRSALLVQQACILMGSVVAQRWSAGARHGNMLVPVTLLLLAAITVAASTNRGFLGLLGVESEYRVASTEMLESASEYERLGVAATAAFPVLYLLSETAGLNPQSWNQLDAAWLRGTLALPWILLVVPSLVLGVRHLITTTNDSLDMQSLGRYSLARLRRSKALSTPWCVVLLFVGSYFAISWLVGDTTRWRTPDMPMTVAIALAGWMHTAPAIRRKILACSAPSIVFLYCLLYYYRGT